MHDKSQPKFCMAFALRTFHSCFVWGDGSTLNANIVALDGLGSIESDMIVCSIAIFNAKVVVVKLDVQVRLNELEEENVLGNG